MDKENKRILLVENTPEDARRFESLLRRGGYGVLVVRSGYEVLDAARKERPDLVLLDIVMPGKDGGDVLFELKQDPKTSDIPVLLLSRIVADGEGGPEEPSISKTASDESVLTKIAEMLS